MVPAAAFFDYEKLASLMSEDTIPVDIYRSKSTGLRVVTCQIPGPIVNGYFLLPTEAHDDDGLPHTLEHLIFLGSEDYPYKGILDVLANRCFAQGTNAWTDTDHTVYTVETAGSQGFLNFLPIYIEHILYPTLTESAYVTEVHHITETGEDGGVVYCEMQGRENSGESRTHLELMRELYPGHCGFKSETGGIMRNLRESTSNEKVREYHAKYYRPDNLVLIVSGQVKAEEIFEAMAPMDEKIRRKLSERQLPKMERPWTSAVPAFEQSVKRIVPFGNDTEDKGMVLIGFRAGNATDIYKKSCQSIILDYFVDTSVAPLRQEFVEGGEAAVCSNVRWSMMEATECSIYFRFSNVDVQHLESIQPRFFAAINKELQKGLNMERLAAIVEKYRLETLNGLEDSPHETLSGDVIGHILFGESNEGLNDRLNGTKLFERATRETEQFWKDTLSEIISQRYAEVIGKPSIEEKQRLATEVEERIGQRKKDLGEEGLKKKGEVLESAVEENEKEAPDEMLSMLPIPDVEKIQFHNLKMSSNYRKVDEETKVNLGLFPFITQLDDIQETQFIAWTLIMDSSKLRDDLKPYLMLWTELIGETAVKDECENVISYGAVVEGLERDTLACSCGMGVFGGGRFSVGAFPETVAVSMKVDCNLPHLKRYREGVTWLTRLLFRQNFEAERVMGVVKKILNDVDGVKRSGSAVTSSTHLKMLLPPNCNKYHALVLNQETILTKCLNTLQSDPAKLLNDLKEITSHLCQLKYMRLHLTAPVEKVNSVESEGDPSVDSVTHPWTNIFLQSWSSFMKTSPGGDSGDICADYGAFNLVRMSELWKKCAEVDVKSAIVAVGAVESSYLVHSQFVEIDKYDHPDIAPFMVLNEYLTGLEGPMWRLIRGLGYSYGYGINLSIESSSITLRLIKATNLPKAYQKSIEIIQEFLSGGEEEFEESTLEASRSSVMFEIIEREKTISDATQESMMNHLRGMDKSYNQNLLKQVSEVELPDLVRVCEKYLSGFFNPETSFCVAVCHPSKVDEIAAQIEQMPPDAAKFGRKMKKFESFEQVFNN